MAFTATFRYTHKSAKESRAILQLSFERIKKRKTKGQKHTFQCIPFTRLSLSCMSLLFRAAVSKRAVTCCTWQRSLVWLGIEVSKSNCEITNDIGWIKSYVHLTAVCILWWELSHWQRCMRSAHGHHLVHTYSSMWLHTILCCVKMILYDMHIRSNLAWLRLQLLKKSAYFVPAAEPRKQLFIHSVQGRPNGHNSLRSNTA